MIESEFSRPVRDRQLPAEPISISANEAERVALAKRFGIPAVGALAAELSVEQDGRAILATGTLTAELTQTCAVSGEDFAVNVAEPVGFRFIQASAASAAAVGDAGDAGEEIEIELSAEDCDEIEYEGDSFDLGEAVAQSLGLAIDPYAVGPDAELARKEAGLLDEDASGPLAAALSGLNLKQ